MACKAPLSSSVGGRTGEVEWSHQPSTQKRDLGERRGNAVALPSIIFFSGSSEAHTFSGKGGREVVRCNLGAEDDSPAHLVLIFL